MGYKGDRAKGIIAKPMPSNWYSIRDNIVKAEDDEETIKRKNFYRKIAAAHKPYFMIYVYPNLRTENNTYNSDSDNGSLMRFGSLNIKSFDDLYAYEPKTREMINCLKLHEKLVGSNPCTINKICWYFEDIFKGYLSKKYKQPEFDYNILKSDTEYSRKNYDEVLEVYKNYRYKLDSFQKKMRKEKLSEYDIAQQRKLFSDQFRCECEMICNNEKELCNIVLDICYRTNGTKQFAWDICGDVILDNLLEKNGHMIHFPALVGEEKEHESNAKTFLYAGQSFEIQEKAIGGDWL